MHLSTIPKVLSAATPYWRGCGDDTRFRVGKVRKGERQRWGFTSGFWGRRHHWTERVRSRMPEKLAEKLDVCFVSSSEVCEPFRSGTTSGHRRQVPRDFQTRAGVGQGSDSPGLRGRRIHCWMDTIGRLGPNLNPIEGPKRRCEAAYEDFAAKIKMKKCCQKIQNRAS